MLPSSNSDSGLKANQRNTARFNFRTTERIKKTVERAAALTGQDMSSFAINAVYQRAIATIQAHEVTHLEPEDHQAFFDALDNPPAPTEKLSAAFARHEEQVDNR